MLLEESHITKVTGISTDKTSILLNKCSYSELYIEGLLFIKVPTPSVLFNSDTLRPSAAFRTNASLSCGIAND